MMDPAPQPEESTHAVSDYFEGEYPKVHEQFRLKVYPELSAGFSTHTITKERSYHNPRTWINHAVECRTCGKTYTMPLYKTKGGSFTFIQKHANQKHNNYSVSGVAMEKMLSAMVQDLENAITTGFEFGGRVPLKNSRVEWWS